MLAVALRNPAPPSASSGRQSSSMPDQTISSGPHSCSTRLKCSKSFVVSLTPTKLSTSRYRRRDGLGRDVDGGARRHVVGDDRQVGELGGDGLVPDVQRLLGGAGVVRRDDQRGVDAELDGGGGELDRLVQLRGAGADDDGDAVGDRLGDRRDRGDALLDRLCAPGSPVEPPIETPWVPLASCHSTRFARLSWSTAPSAVNGVIRGTIDPRISCGVLRKRMSVSLRQWCRDAR